MRAAVYSGFRGPDRGRDLPDPTPADDEVVVRVKATGVAAVTGTDGRDTTRTSDLPPCSRPRAAGVIKSVGEDVVGRIGATGYSCRSWPAVADANIVAREPQVCPNQVQPGFTHWGSFAELVTIRHAQHNLVRIPDDSGSRRPRSSGVGSHGVSGRRRAGGVKPREWVAVHGCGGVGLSAVMIASAVGATVIAVDTNPAALGLAVSLGAAHTLTPGPDLASRLQRSRMAACMSESMPLATLISWRLACLASTGWATCAGRPLARSAGAAASRSADRP